MATCVRLVHKGKATMRPLTFPFPSGKQFDAATAILKSLSGLKVDLNIEASVKLDDCMLHFQSHFLSFLKAFKSLLTLLSIKIPCLLSYDLYLAIIILIPLFLRQINLPCSWSEQLQDPLPSIL